MNCRELEEQLAEDPYREVSEQARLHLEECEACRVLLNDLRALRELSCELRDRAQAPAFFETRVCSRVGKQGHRFAHWRVIGAVSAVVLFSLGLVRFFGEGFQLPDDRESRVDVIDPEETSERTLVFGSSESLAGSEGDLSSDFQMIDRPIEVLIPKVDTPGFLLELPARIEVRQTQAENEFYLKSVSH
jgi:hypothetical protein